MRTVFLGTADLACASLSALAGSGWTPVVAVVTQPDRPQGRSLQRQPSPVKRLALELGLPVLQPERSRAPGFLADLAGFAPDLAVVVAYGQILPADLLKLPRHGCLNVHTSLLPRHRGAAPIQWAVLEGDAETGVTIMQIDVGLDTGPIVSQRSTPIGPEATSEQLHDRLAQMGAELLLESLPDYVEGRTLPRPQPEEGASYARKIVKEDGRVDWTQAAAALLRRKRALAPWPGLFTTLPGKGRPSLLKIWEAVEAEASGAPGTILGVGPDVIRAACGAGALDLAVVQKEGGRRMTAREFLAGHPLAVGERLG